jgi:hypothetical protein
MIATPPPDSPTGRAVINWSYYYWTGAETKAWPHTIIPGESFRCEVPVHGKRVCVLFHHPIPKGHR